MRERERERTAPVRKTPFFRPDYLSSKITPHTLRRFLFFFFAQLVYFLCQCRGNGGLFGIEEEFSGKLENETTLFDR